MPREQRRRIDPLTTVNSQLPKVGAKVVSQPTRALGGIRQETFIPRSTELGNLAKSLGHLGGGLRSLQGNLQQIETRQDERHRLEGQAAFQAGETYEDQATLGAQQGFLKAAGAQAALGVQQDLQTLFETGEVNGVTFDSSKQKFEDVAQQYLQQKLAGITEEDAPFLSTFAPAVDAAVRRVSQVSHDKRISEFNQMRHDKFVDGLRAAAQDAESYGALRDDLFQSWRASGLRGSKFNELEFKIIEELALSLPGEAEKFLSLLKVPKGNLGKGLRDLEGYGVKAKILVKKVRDARLAEDRKLDALESEAKDKAEDEALLEVQSLLINGATKAERDAFMASILSRAKTDPLIDGRFVDQARRLLGGSGSGGSQAEIDKSLLARIAAEEDLGFKEVLLAGGTPRVAGIAQAMQDDRLKVPLGEIRLAINETIGMSFNALKGEGDEATLMGQTIEKPLADLVLMETVEAFKELPAEEQTLSRGRQMVSEAFKARNIDIGSLDTINVSKMDEWNKTTFDNPRIRSAALNMYSKLPDHVSRLSFLDKMPKDAKDSFMDHVENLERDKQTKIDKEKNILELKGIKNRKNNFKSEAQVQALEEAMASFREDLPALKDVYEKAIKADTRNIVGRARGQSKQVAAYNRTVELFSPRAIKLFEKYFGKDTGSERSGGRGPSNYWNQRKAFEDAWKAELRKQVRGF